MIQFNQTLQSIYNSLYQTIQLTRITIYLVSITPILILNVWNFLGHPTASFGDHETDVLRFDEIVFLCDVQSEVIVAYLEVFCRVDWSGEGSLVEKNLVWKAVVSRNDDDWDVVTARHDGKHEGAWWGKDTACLQDAVRRNQDWVTFVHVWGNLHYWNLLNLLFFFDFLLLLSCLLPSGLLSGLRGRLLLVSDNNRNPSKINNLLNNGLIIRKGLKQQDKLFVCN